MKLKNKDFPDNPFLHTYAIIMISAGLVMLAATGVSIWQENWWWFAGGLVISIIIFVALNKQCLRELSCPKCKKEHITFEAGVGLVCKKCKIAWQLN
ncbi:MAG: hypothetical protein Q9M17_00695 [Mariprofundus sp.]|nr:hypothetical protein [Mariprofundus sp.]